jgi:hypothetical protein
MSRERILILAAVIGVVVAGAAGYLAGQSAGQAQAATTRARFFQERGQGGTGAGGPGGGFGGGFAAGGPGNGGFANGQVKSIQGDTITLSTPRDVTTVKVDDKTTIRKAVDGSLADIKPGDMIVVQGSRNADGSLGAQSIQLGLNFGRGGGPGGAGGARRPTASP